MIWFSDERLAALARHAAEKKHELPDDMGFGPRGLLSHRRPRREANATLLLMNRPDDEHTPPAGIPITPIAEEGDGIAEQGDGIAMDDDGDGRQDFRRLRARGSRGLGWLPDLPDIRDYTFEHPKIQASPLMKATSAPLKTAPTKIDVRGFFSPVEDQLTLGSCTIQAYVALLEYFERRALGRHVDASRLFGYKITRKLMGVTGDTGAHLRTTMQAAALIGLPPEKHYPYVIKNFDLEPDPFIYQLAQNWQATSYFRLDPAGSTGAQALANVKARLAAGQPSMFGFTVYSSMPYQTTTGVIPYPKAGDRVDGGHAVVAVGYDDAFSIDGTKGAVMIRNSWGTRWGVKGYGWMSYRWFVDRLAVDIWSLARSEYVDLVPFA